ncbi:protein MpDUO1 [Marchantia polymorpha subsp. ruderalis]
MKTIQNGDEVLRKGPWMPEEDEILVEYVRQFGARDWSSIRSKGLLPRTGKSCRLRWVNKLKPDLKRSGCKFSPEEEKLVVEMQAKLGNKWAKIASCLPGRTDNDVKNFWSTRQKRILRALQRPKMPSGSTDAAADTSDLRKDPSITDYGAFQVHSPSGTGLVPSGFVTPFMFEDDNTFREPPGHLRLRHSVQPFNSLEVDDVLSLKLQDMVAGDSHFTDSDFSQCGRVLDDPRHGSVMYQHSPRMMITPRNARSVKRRPRSRRDARSCFEHHSGTDGGQDSVQMLPEIGLPLIQGNSRDFGVPLSTEQQNNNYLDFLLQTEASSMHSSQMFSPELPSFLTNSQQWEKLPMLYSNDPSIQEPDVKDSDSCSPDSVISGFAADVFDSLEPLCPAAPEWWVARLS